MKTILDFIKSTYPNCNDIQLAHIESLLKDLEHKAVSNGRAMGFDRGLNVGRQEGEREERLRQQGWK